MSRAILERIHRSALAKGNAGITVAGLAWMDGEARQLAPAALASNVLCKRHNEDLSPLDAEAERLFAAFETADAMFRVSRDESIGLLRLFHGPDIERWLLKALCGLMASGNLTLEQGETVRTDWVDVLFGRRELEGRRGLYVSRVVGSYELWGHGIGLRPIARRSLDNHIVGVTVWLYSAVLTLLMEPPPDNATSIVGVEHDRHPLELVQVGDSGFLSVLFSWPSRLGGGSQLKVMRSLKAAP